jgi:GNAT superfamily N-acetyltransferase
MALVRELAQYERAPEQVISHENDLRQALFCANPRVFCRVAVTDHIVGYAIYFVSFSTWLGQHGLYLEDLYVTSSVRGQGIGSALLKELACECLAQGYARLEWSVLNWNTPAWDFYRTMGAEPMDEWTMHRITGAALRTLAGNTID